MSFEWMSVLPLNSSICVLLVCGLFWWENLLSVLSPCSALLAYFNSVQWRHLKRTGSGWKQNRSNKKQQIAPDAWEGWFSRQKKWASLLERRKLVPICRRANRVVLWSHIKRAHCQGRAAVGGQRETPKIGVDYDKEGCLSWLGWRGEELEYAHLSTKQRFGDAVGPLPPLSTAASINTHWCRSCGAADPFSCRPVKVRVHF